MRRREYLAGASGPVLAGLAGCQAGDDEPDPDNEYEEPHVDVDEFVTRWKTDNGGMVRYTQIELPLLASGNYDFEVFWGDGTSDRIEAHDDEAVLHTYDERGEYEVTIEGELTGWSFERRSTDDESNGASNLVEIAKWGGFDVSTGTRRSLDTPGSDLLFRTDFRGATDLAVTADDTPALEAGNTLDRLFARTDLSQASNLGSWNVSNIEYMWGMFFRASGFDANLNDWDVSNVQDMHAMFARAESFDGDIADWDVSAVVLMSAMFAYASSFDGTVRDWDTSSVENMENMFKEATAFTGDLKGWNTSQVTTMETMFKEAASFDSDLDQWDVSSVESMVDMFHGATSFDGDLSGWDVSNVTAMKEMSEVAGLSRENYDRILTSWQKLELENGVEFSAGDTTYSPSEPAAARQQIIDQYNWKISDGGVAE